MRGAVFLAVVFVASAVAGGELFQGAGWGPHAPPTGQVNFGGVQWVLTGGESVDGGHLRSFDLYGYAERIDIGVSDGQGGSILLESVMPSGPADGAGWTHYDVAGVDLLSTNGGHPFTTFGGHSGGPRYGLHDGYFTKVAGSDIPNSPSNAIFMPDGANAGGIVIMRFIWETLDPPYGDGNNDGRIDLNDFGLVKASFDSVVAEPFTGGDLTGNGRVNMNDFALLKQNFGWHAPPAAVPEAFALHLCLTGAVAAIVFHRARTHWPRRRISAARPKSSLLRH